MTDKDAEIARLKARIKYLEAQLDSERDEARLRANNIQRTAQRHGYGFAGCGNE